jgi:cellulose synthase/poly-beta-1,6-N-acetylglucosamine synthase-like glycosyltransferase
MKQPHQQSLNHSNPISASPDDTPAIRALFADTATRRIPISPVTDQLPTMRAQPPVLLATGQLPAVREQSPVLPRTDSLPTIRALPPVASNVPPQSSQPFVYQTSHSELLQPGSIPLDMTKRMKRTKSAKSAHLYLLILLCWAILVVGSIPSLFVPVTDAFNSGTEVGLLTLISTGFLLYFWLNGMKDVVYTLFYHVYLKRHKTPITHSGPRSVYPLIYLVYCTCNDFNAASLAKSMEQSYPNIRTFILDDSSNPAFKNEIDIFARKNLLSVIRRTDREGFKAGNLNHFLKQAPCDYFVILDSDEIIPPLFVERALDYFDARPEAGIVQANHVATRNRNYFMSVFSIGVDSHWVAYQSVKERYGFLSLLGHGAMISMTCYHAVNGFPHVVAEDLCFSIEARKKGYVTLFAPDIVCQEEYPISYLAFKKRHSKWTQGNMEFIKKYTSTIIRSPMTWFEKLDIFLFTYNLPLTIFFSFYVVINVILLPLLHAPIRYPLWMLIPTGAFLVAPMLNDIVTYAGKKKTSILLLYLLYTLLLYGSMFYVSFKSSFISLFGKAVFLVTPKATEQVTFKKSFWANMEEVLFAVVLCLVCYLVNRTVMSVILIAVPSLMSVYLAMLSNRLERMPIELPLLFPENRYAGQQPGKYQLRLYDYAPSHQGQALASSVRDSAKVFPENQYAHQQPGRHQRSLYDYVPSHQRPAVGAASRDSA